jgi:hypothetical protein
MAGGSFSWGEASNNLIAGGDQPHNWADVYWLILFRDLFAFEDDSTLQITPALFRRWHEPGLPEFTRDTVILASPPRHQEIRVSVQAEPW